VTLDVAALVERARVAAAEGRAGDAPGAEREKLKRIAAEFESMLLVQVLKDMRRAGSWEEEGASDSLGAESLFETLDVELASHLARVKGLGLSKQLEDAFERAHPGLAPAVNSQLPTSNSQSGSLLATSGVPVTTNLEVGSWKLGVDLEAGGAAKDAPRAEKSNPLVAALRTAAEATVAVPQAVTQMVKPVAGAVTSAFGWRQDPFTRQMKFHQGVDLRAAYGQDVNSAAAGKVVFSGEQGGYGTTVIVEHADGMRTRYAHLSERLVKKGDQLAAGQPLGRAGHSGRAAGTHLHFEVMAADGTRVHPEQWAGGRSPLALAAEVGKPAGVPMARPVKDRGPDAD
jgi:murein DD-endopeptidase MepM/ murein hydrolase activator NlpD